LGTGVKNDLSARWNPLREWTLRSDPAEVSPAARELLGGIEPQNPSNRRELLALALLAVSVDPDRLREEFAARNFLGTQAPLDALVARQQHLTKAAIGTSGPLKTLGVLVSESLPNDAVAQLHRSKEPAWAKAIGWRQEAEVMWLAAVRFGHLAQTIAQALSLGQTVHFYRFLSANCSNHSTPLLPNDIACVNEPWSEATDRMLDRAEEGSPIFELAVPPAGIVAVAHYDPSRAHQKHPADFIAESGHPVITAYPPLAQFAPHHYEGTRHLVRWRQVSPAQVRNH